MKETFSIKHVKQLLEKEIVYKYVILGTIFKTLFHSNRTKIV